MHDSSDSDSSLELSPERKRSRKDSHHHDRRKKDDGVREKKRKKESKHKRVKKSSSSTSHKTIKSDPLKPDTIWISDTNLDPKDAYRLDTKSDTTNLSYDTLYSGDQASYRRYFGDLCLGLDRSLSLKFTDRRSRVWKKHQKSALTRYHQMAGLEPTETTELKFSTLLHDQLEDTEMETLGHVDVLLLEMPKKKQMANKEKDKEETLLTPEVYLMKKTSYYNQTLLQRPHDISMWLEFIRYQDEASLWGKTAGPAGWMEGENETESRKKLNVALMERKVAIYERALENNPFSVELIVGYMELVEELWDTEKLVGKWKHIVFMNPHRSLLWLKYIEFCISRFSFFQTQTIISLFGKAISTLASILDRKLLSHKPEEEADKRLLSLYIFYCYFLRQIGQTEKAVATFQALIEFNLLCPSDVIPEHTYYPRTERRGYMEEFWNSDEPRFGEDGALGWHGWLQEKLSKPLGLFDVSEYSDILKGADKNKSIEASETSPLVEKEDFEDVELVLINGLSLNEAWMKLECHRDQRDCLPGRMNDESAVDDDPDRMVLYDDVMESLFIVSDTDLRYVLLVEFLRFLGAPCPSSSLLLTTFPHMGQTITCSHEVIPSSLYLFQPLHNFSSNLSSCYHQPLLLGIEYGILIGTTAYDNLYCDSSIGGKSLIISMPSQVSKFTLSFHLKHFISTVFNQSLSLIPKDSIFGSILMCSWLQFELNYLMHLSQTGTDLQTHIEQLHALATALLQTFTKHNFHFLWEFTVSLEQLLPLKKKASLLSKTLLQPFIDNSPAVSNEATYSLAQCFVEYMLGLRVPMNCYSKHQPDRMLALFSLVCLSDSSFNPTLLPTSEVKVSNALKLKADKFFQELTLQTIASLTVNEDKGYLLQQFPKLACHIFFEYLHRGLDSMYTLSNNMLAEIRRTATDTVAPNSTNLAPLLECVVILQIRLIVVHSLRHPTTPKILRDAVYNALNIFPSHSWLLQVLIDSERRSFVSGRLRRYFDRTLSKSISVLPLLFAVRAELERHHFVLESLGQGECIDEPVTGMLHRIRSLFRRGSESRSNRLCPAFWRCYMQFEVSPLVFLVNLAKIVCNI